MPHDIKNKKLSPGDRVMIECVVDSVQETETCCNCTLHTVRPMPPYETGTTIVLNTKQTEKIGEE